MNLFKRKKLTFIDVINVIDAKINAYVSKKEHLNAEIVEINNEIAILRSEATDVKDKIDTISKKLDTV